MLAVEVADVFGIFFMKGLLFGNPNAGGGPHIRYVDVLIPMVVEIEPACAHACANIFHTCFSGNGGKSSVAVVAVKIAASEIVGHVQIGKAVALRIAPCTSEAVTIVVCVKPGLFGAIFKRSVTLVAEQKIWWAIARVEIGDRVAILI